MDLRNMEKVLKLCLLVLAVLGCFLSQCEGLQCYTCDMSECHDPFNGTINEHFLQECDMDYKNETHNSCKKMITTIWGVRDLETVIVAKITKRTCAVVPEGSEDQCWYEKSADGGFQYCYCSEDGCNHGSHVFGSLTAVLLGLFSFIIIYMRS